MGRWLLAIASVLIVIELVGHAIKILRAYPGY